jgi:hypothetical protein
MNAVVLCGSELADDRRRFGAVTALGLDETLFCRVGPFRAQCWIEADRDVRS